MRQKIKISLLVIVYIFCFSVINVAQKVNSEVTHKTTVNQTSNKLQKKLLLSEKQKNSVKNILNEYFNEVSNLSKSPKAHQNQKQLQNNADKKIINLLDAKQKMKFDIVKDDWWASANK